LAEAGANLVICSRHQDEIESIESFHPFEGYRYDSHTGITIFPANIFVTSQDKMKLALREIEDDMWKQAAFFRETGKAMEAKRLEDRVSYDVEMMRELGFCSGIENYSRHLSGRLPGEPPPTLLDYLPQARCSSSTRAIRRCRRFAACTTGTGRGRKCWWSTGSVSRPPWTTAP
jgi:excinuclease UvrABC helicase subunit UvrB